MAAAQTYSDDTCASKAGASIPLNSRTVTNNSVCSISTEKDVPGSKNFADREDEQCEVAKDDGTIETTSITTTSSSNSNKNHDQSLSLLHVPQQLGDNTDVSMLQYFYDTVVIGAETVASVACTMSDEKTSLKSADSIETIITENSAGENNNGSSNNILSWQLSNVSASSHETCLSVKTDDPTQIENAVEGIEIQPSLSRGGEKAEGFEIHPEKWCGLSQAIMLSNNDRVGNTVNILAEVLNILGTTFAGTSEGITDIGENMMVSKTSTAEVECPRVDELLMKIDTIGGSLSMEADDEDHLIEKLVAVKQHLLEINDLLKSATDDDKAEYFRVILRTATLNAEVATRRSQLELEKVCLESVGKNQTGSGNVLDLVWNKLKWKKMSLKW